jgi:hypothetical protein
MLTQFYWVLKIALSDENIYAYPLSMLPVNPHLFYFVVIDLE